MKSNEDLKQLLSQFLDEHDALHAAEDIDAGDRLFERYPAPTVTRQTIELVRSRVAARTRQQRLFGGLTFAGTAAAAAVVVWALLHAPQTPPENTPTQLASATRPVSSPAVLTPVKSQELKTAAPDLWNRLASHESLHQIDRELTDVADSIEALDSEPYGEFVNTMKIDLLELEELELLTANSDFWKG
jgi:hypothetical protein